MSKKNINRKSAVERTRDAAVVALFAAIIAVCSVISIPAAVPFTLQTFGIFASLFLLGGRRGTLSVLLYIALGLVGLPVFSGFKGGAGVLMGATGGYITGFVLLALLYTLLTAVFGEKTFVKLIAAVSGLAVLYAFGTAWFVYVYAAKDGTSFISALAMCVFPFILPDALKIGAAFLVAQGVKRRISI